MVAERRRVISTDPQENIHTSPRVMEQRRDHFRIWQELDSEDLSGEERIDREAHLLWLDVALGFRSTLEHRIELANFFVALEESGNQAALDYIQNDMELPNGSVIPRMFEIRRRVLRDDEFAKLRAIR
jgi:heme oxygenase